ncbi:DUF1501 domain-containing protein [Stieleria sp. ICT_E10.1]|uniref:DUF1501 domain-containing protein n=1 Tax=Stieleria sedimenti TaxID=2976331 RepID=UPI00217F33F3|nr:DUF1501 domain-containing protein [Stieleria sedimenti]MCS7467299.1 DUF1501 domain-containing protein [Stieleria sedimenti]
MSHHDLLCDPHTHLSRRTLLGAGAGGAMLSTIAHQLAWADAVGATETSRPKNVILLWLEGGPSQLETFDPHPGSAIGGEVNAIPTSVPDLQIADTLPRVAEKMHLGSLIRSVTSKEGDHQRAIYNIKSGYRPDPTLVHPSIGSILCHEFPEQLDIPRHISILPQNAPARGGYLGPVYDAFKIGDPQNPVPDLKSPIAEERFDRRMKDLQWLEDRFRRQRLRDLDQNRTLHQSSTDAALRMMSSEQVSAFDVSSESKETLERFGQTPFGRGCLAATRLIGAGVRCVEVTLGGWDSHITNHSLQSARCEILDAALAGLLDRLVEQDLLETTLVVCGGEFGRTPQINAAEGRDHWPHGFSTFLAGCGIRKGGVYGATAKDPKLDPDKPLADVGSPITIGDLHATILSTLGVPYHEERQTPIGRPLRISEGEPVKDLLA